MILPSGRTKQTYLHACHAFQSVGGSFPGREKINKKQQFANSFICSLTLIIEWVISSSKYSWVVIFITFSRPEKELICNFTLSRNWLNFSTFGLSLKNQRGWLSVCPSHIKISCIVHCVFVRGYCLRPDCCRAWPE